jgi:hypothetical protein
MSLTQGPGVFVQRLSIWKTLGMELLLVAGAVFPLTPNFSQGLVYTAFLYRMPFFILLLASCVVLGLFAVVFLLFLWRAVLRTPVLTISGEAVMALGSTVRLVSKADIVRVVSVSPGTINLQIRGERPLALPIFLYQQPGLTMDRLGELISQQPTPAAHVAS